MATKGNTNSKRGNYYKYKTKKWFEASGYICEYLERYKTIFIKGRNPFHIKQDLFGSDGMAMNDRELIFWQSKLGQKNIKEAINIYKTFPFPPFVETWVVVWTPRKKEPEVYVDGKLTANYGKGKQESKKEKES